MIHFAARDADMFKFHPPHRYQLAIRHLPLDVCFFAIPGLFLHHFTVFQGHDGLRGREQRQAVNSHTEETHGGIGSDPVLVLVLVPGHTNPRLPVVCGRLVKRFVELESDLSGLECALRLHAHNPLIVHGHYQIGLGSIPHLPGCKSHTCAAKINTH